jgi:hypothetical protein
LAYLSLTLVHAIRGLRFVFVRTPWQPAYHVVYAAFLGVAVKAPSSTSTTGATTS